MKWAQMPKPEEWAKKNCPKCECEMHIRWWYMTGKHQWICKCGYSEKVKP